MRSGVVSIKIPSVHSEMEASGIARKESPENMKKALVRS
jgi:hypothetical protein